MIVEMSEIIDIIHRVFKEDIVKIKPCGNHDLNRNLVYIVETQSQKVVIKFYSKKGKRIREIETLQMLPWSKLHVLAIGISNDDKEWLIYNYIEGVMLDAVYQNLCEANKATLFFEIGTELGRLHSSKTFDYFGDWHDEKKSDVSMYKAFVEADTNRIIKNIRIQELPHKEILLKAATIAEDAYHEIEHLKHGCLVHRDFDGRNIILKKDIDGFYRFQATLDFEKCVSFSPLYDVAGLYRKYFILEPHLVEHFFKGYFKTMTWDDSYKGALRFQLYRMGLDIGSWSLQVSEAYYNETIRFLSQLMEKEGQFNFEDMIAR